MNKQKSLVYTRLISKNLRRCRDDRVATWKSKIKWHSDNNHFKDMNRIDGRPTEFEWTIFPGITTLGLLEKIQSQMRDLKCEPEHFQDRIIFMSMYNDTECGAEGNPERCDTIHRQLRIMLVDSLAVIGLPWGSDQKRNNTELTLADPTDLWTKLQNK